MTKDLDVKASGAVVGETGLVNLGVGEEILKGIIYSAVSKGGEWSRRRRDFKHPYA
jgi:hypothetical protein